MIVERDATEQEMVLEFLRAEYPAALGAIGLDLSDPEQNRSRAQALDMKRGYISRKYVFAGFPTDTTWSRVRLVEEDFPRLRHIDCSPFRQLAGDGLNVRAGAERLYDEKFPELVRRRPKIEGIARAIRQGAKLPPVIVAEAGPDLILLEGNHRATAYFLAWVMRDFIVDERLGVTQMVVRRALDLTVRFALLAL
jgi:hypothetical protein